MLVRSAVYNKYLTLDARAEVKFNFTAGGNEI